VHAYDIASGRWSEVDNPGIIGWDETAAR